MYLMAASILIALIANAKMCPLTDQHCTPAFKAG
jgi:hypothetical protein